HCWCKAGILPDMALPQATQPIIPVMTLLNADSNQPDPITEAEKEVEEALNQLQSTSVLQPQNRMTIEALNLAEEVHHMEQASDNDICQAVLEAQEAQKNMVISGGDDNGSNNTSLQAQLTRHKVQQAASLINVRFR
ncbi:hypothetical protein C0993_004119, partial [Termitomyces sp. T159_Od127]